MDYNTLVASKGTPGSLANWANYGLFDTTSVLEDAQAFLYTTLRCREMRSELLALNIPQGASAVGLPSDFLDPIVVLNQWMRGLKLRDPRTLLQRMGTTGNPPSGFVTGLPTSYAIFGEMYNFDLAANAALAYWQVYYQRPALLSPTNNTNFLTNRYPHVLRGAILAVAARFRGDTEDFQREASLLQAMVADLKAQDDLSMRGIWVDADYEDS